MSNDNKEETKNIYIENLKQKDNELREFYTRKYSIENFESYSIFQQNKKLYEKLKLLITNQNLYEADQLYKIMHFRCLNQNLHQQSIDLLFNGILYFSRTNSFECAFDLSKVFVETLKLLNKFNDEIRIMIKIIHELLGTFKKATTEERSDFGVAILKWSGTLFKKNQLDPNNKENILNNYQCVFGHCDIHRDFAINFWKERNYIQSRYHFLHSLDAVSFAHMIIECQLNFGNPTEFDIFLAQCVLQYLCLRNLESANEFFNVYTKNHPQIVTVSHNNIVSFESPLINFIYFLLNVLKDKNETQFRSLLFTYKTVIKSDPSFRDYLERVGEYFFNIKQAKKEQNGLFSNLFKIISGGSSSTQNDTSSHSNLFNNDDDEFAVEDINDDDMLD